MNSENRYPVAASLFMLKEMKLRHERVSRGHQLLKRKVEALRYRGRQAAAELAATQGILGHTLKEAYISLAAVKFTNGESNAMVLENIGEAQVRVLRVPENISGVSTVSLQAIEDTGASDALRYAGLGAGGHRTGEAKKAFREAVRLLIKFASLRNTCILLDEAIKSNLRKVNGIEKVIMPKLRNTEIYIMMEMDEREREEFHRLKMVKAKKIRNQGLQNLRHAHEKAMTCSPSGGGESEYGETASPIFNEGKGDTKFLLYDRFPDALKVKQAPAHIRYTEVLTSILYAYSSGLTSKSSAEDYKPVCYSSTEDDEDLLF